MPAAHILHLRKTRRPRVTLQYEALTPDADYNERGTDTGAKIDQAPTISPEMLRIFHETKNLDCQGTVSWLKDNANQLDDSTFVVDTDDGHALEPLKAVEPEIIINVRSLNTIRHLNTFLNCANEVLVQGGCLWCHARTSALKKALIYRNYPGPYGKIYYLCHYMWHRVCAKVPGFKKIYFALTRGENRTYNRTEILGRMYRAGFEVIDENFRRGEFFVLGRKSKAPIWDDEPSCGPLVKLPRIGQGGNIIGVYKFRTMYSYSEYLQGYVYQHEGLQKGGKFADDYRVNIWGKLLRKTWLDEFPMFINVFKGQMKLVGVRPLSRHYFSLYTPEMQQLRTQVKPGLLPPFYYESRTPETIEEVQDSERRYIESYLRAPLRTDWRYFWGSVRNIIFGHKRSN